ncbi:DUF6233 domain-containing protein [Streptomyces sp. NPDC047009]|uniref:DUF6233 domain-containing protein n=1 Tax=Streptomyces sp. NPDC047009 TaxID=3154496 RepID=UPI0033C8C983
MSELPPDPTRLRVILAWLEEQVTDNATVGTFVRLQRDTVTQAFAQTEGESEQQRAEPPPAAPAKPPRMTGLPTSTSRGPGFKVVEQGDLVSLHLDDCNVDDGPTRRVDAHEAVAALREGLAACVMCRPDLELGG